jgi:hypothetical protein
MLSGKTIKFLLTSNFMDPSNKYEKNKIVKKANILIKESKLLDIK